VISELLNIFFSYSIFLDFLFEKDISKKNVRFFIYFQKIPKTELKEFLENFCFFLYSEKKFCYNDSCNKI